MDTVIKVALGVFLGTLMLFLLRVAYVNYIVSEVTETLTKSNQRMIEQSQARIKAQKEKIAYEEHQKALLAQAEEEAAALKIINEQKKEEAWAKFYKQPKDCLSYKSQKHMVECGNKRIRARREFDKKWDENVL